ncbi:MAG: DnaJ domain-containing protein [Bacteroidota bacterium]
MKQSAYETLGITIDATEREIKRQYKRMVRQYTPEQQPEKFLEIQEAYESLTRVVSEVPKQFPLYLGREEAIEKKESEVKKSHKEHLSAVYETPYNTFFELKQLMETK